jgi:hypothetical protein
VRETSNGEHRYEGIGCCFRRIVWVKISVGVAIFARIQLVWHICWLQHGSVAKSSRGG